MVKHEYHGRFLVSSFNSENLVEIEKVRKLYYGGRVSTIDGAPQSFEIIYLYNFENKPLPEADIYTNYGDGINISANFIT